MVRAQIYRLARRVTVSLALGGGIGVPATAMVAPH
jgi:hypothetical protein